MGGAASVCIVRAWLRVCVRSFPLTLRDMFGVVGKRTKMQNTDQEANKVLQGFFFAGVSEAGDDQGE